MISGIRVKNIRSLRDTGQIPLKKINVIVGQNSSGKSTFLRLFPLLRQSIEVRTKGPVLWYGRLVDFGSFAEARSADPSAEKVTLSFDVTQPRFTRRKHGIADQPFSSYKLPRNVRLTVTMGRDENDVVGFISEIGLQIGNDAAFIEMSESRIKSIKINNKIFLPTSDQLWRAAQTGFLPTINFYVFQESDGKKFIAPDNYLFTKKIVSALHLLAHGNTTNETLGIIARQLEYCQDDVFLNRLNGLSSMPQSLKARLSVFTSDSPQINDIRELVLLASLPHILIELNDTLGRFASGVRYIEPVRASAERYYRLQDLAVDEIDSRGANTAMFLNSMAEYELHILKDWMDKNLGFHAYPDRSVGHVAVKIKITGQDGGRNIADLGFGYSQILPIVLQLWHCCVRGRTVSGSVSKASILTIEQPELHLHPRYQSLLADVFAAVSNPENRLDSSPPMILETHSEHIVNRFGTLISRGILDRKSIQVLLFEQEEGITKVRRVEFDDAGVLAESWPLGFFLPEA